MYAVLIECGKPCESGRTIVTWMHSIVTRQAMYQALDDALEYVERIRNICSGRVVVCKYRSDC